MIAKVVEENLKIENVLCSIGAYYWRFKTVLVNFVIFSFYHGMNRENSHTGFYTLGKINKLWKFWKFGDKWCSLYYSTKT